VHVDAERRRHLRKGHDMTSTTAPAPAGPTASPTAVAGRRARPPAAVVAATALTLLVGAVSAFGSFYFALVYDNANPGPAAYAFVGVFWAATLVGMVGAVGLLRRAEQGRRALLGYCGAQLLWTLAKLVVWHESEALVFGAVTAVVLLAARSRAAQRWTAQG
jgi:hypothetical protein